MLKAAIFDMDGTLMDTEIIWHKAWQKVNKEFNLGVKEEVLETFIGMPKQNFEANVDKFFPHGVDLEKMRPIREQFYKDYEAKYGVAIKPGVIETLNFFKEKGIRLAVCTSTFWEKTERTLKKAELFDQFDLIYTGDNVKIGKPNPEIYLNTLEKLGVKADECIAFEDSSFGVIAAHAANIKTYFIKDIREPNEEAISKMYKRLNTIDEVIKDYGR